MHLSPRHVKHHEAWKYEGQISTKHNHDFLGGNGRRSAIRFPLLFTLLLLFLLCYPYAQLAFSDGGAPELAYVAGTAAGVSVIDIAQQRVSRTLSINGDPNSILLKGMPADCSAAEIALSNENTLREVG